MTHPELDGWLVQMMMGASPTPEQRELFKQYLDVSNELDETERTLAKLESSTTRDNYSAGAAASAFTVGSSITAPLAPGVSALLGIFAAGATAYAILKWFLKVKRLQNDLKELIDVLSRARMLLLVRILLAGRAMLPPASAAP